MSAVAFFAISLFGEENTAVISLFYEAFLSVISLFGEVRSSSILLCYKTLLSVISLFYGGRPSVISLFGKVPRDYTWLMSTPAFSKVWEAIVNASFGLLDEILLRSDGLDQSLALINESLTDAGALLSSPYFSSPKMPEKEDSYWQNAYATKLVAVYACSIAAALRSGPPRMSDEEAIEFYFGSTLGLAAEVLLRHPCRNAIDWHLLLNEQMAKAIRQVRVFDLAALGDKWAEGQIDMVERETSHGEWARTIPVTLLAVAGVALAAITDLCPEGFSYLEDGAFRIPPATNVPEELG